MVNSWSLAYEILNGTMEETYPVREDIPSELWNKPISKYVDDPDPDFKVEGETNEYGQKHSPYYYDYDRNGLDGDPFKQDFLADNDDQAAHHFNLDKEVDRVQLKLNNEVQQETESMTAHYFKYHEEEILKDIESYVSGTYRGHYTGNTHEYRNVQTLDLMAARDIASGFCQANIIKYGSRYGSKDGREKKDLLKVIHYAMLLLHFDEHYGKPSMTSGNIDHTMP